jgi:hypothetical protein
LRSRLAALNGVFRVGLYGNGVAWAQLRRWPQLALSGTPGFVGAADGSRDWNGLLDLLPVTPPPGAACEVWLSGHHLRYLLVPWSPTIVTDRESETYARALFEERFGHDAQTQVFSFGPAAYGRPRLACAMASAMLKGLQERFGRRVAVRPMLAGLVNQWRRQFRRGRQVVIEAEPGRFSGVLLADGCIQAAVSQPLGEDGAAIDQWLRRIAFQSGGADAAAFDLWLHDPGRVGAGGASGWKPQRLEAPGFDDLGAWVRPILVDPLVVRA